MSSGPEAIVLDASAFVEALINSALGRLVRHRVRDCEVHGPAHLDAEVLSALGRLHRAGKLESVNVDAALVELRHAPVVRHPVAELLSGAWAARDQLRLVDGLYVELSRQVEGALVSTDARLARARPSVQLISLS